MLLLTVNPVTLLLPDCPTTISGLRCSCTERSCSTQCLALLSFAQPHALPGGRSKTFTTSGHDACCPPACCCSCTRSCCRCCPCACPSSYCCVGRRGCLKPLVSAALRCSCAKGCCSESCRGQNSTPPGLQSEHRTTASRLHPGTWHLPCAGTAWSSTQRAPSAAKAAASDPQAGSSTLLASASGSVAAHFSACTA